MTSLKYKPCNGNVQYEHHMGFILLGYVLINGGQLNGPIVSSIIGR